jgi:predicted permease
LAKAGADVLEHIISCNASVARPIQGVNEAGIVVEAVLKVFGLIGAGLLLRRLKWLTERVDKGLLWVTINVLFPCLILDASVGNSAFSNPANLMLAPVLGFGMVACSMTVAYWAGRLCGFERGVERRTFAVAAGMQNYSYIPVPLCLLLFDRQTVGVLFLHNVGVEAALWTVCVMLLSGGSPGKSWRNVFNAPLMAIVLAVAVNVTGMDGKEPGWVRMALHVTGECAIPTALVLIGAITAGYLREFFSAAGWGVTGLGVLLRLGLLPMVYLAVARALPVSVELKRVLVLQAAMPSAVFPIVMARHYGGDPPTALRVVIGTSIPGLVTIPLWIEGGLRFIGL